MGDVPRTLANMENTRQYYAQRPKPGQCIVTHYRLVKELTQKSQHIKAAAEWAIHRLVEQGMLTIQPGKWLSPVPSDPEPDYYYVGLEHSLVQSTPPLWEWWTEQEEKRQRNTLRKKPKSRDKWIYQQCCKGTPYDAIVAELKRIAVKRGWQIVKTKQRIQQIGIEYAQQKELPPPPPRQNL
jgi:hypothetical protein